MDWTLSLLTAFDRGSVRSLILCSGSTNREKKLICWLSGDKALTVSVSLLVFDNSIGECVQCVQVVVFISDRLPTDQAWGNVLLRA